MTSTQQVHCGYSFGEFTLDVDRGVLRRGGEEIRLRPKSFDVLRHLVMHAGVLVERRVLMDAVWGNAVVTDDSLTQCIVEIRRAIGDAEQRVVRTVPRRGFIFDAEVRQAAPGATSTPAPDAEPPAVAAAGGSRRPRFAAALVLLGMLAAAGLYWWDTEQRAQVADDATPASEPHARSIAVLRFLDLSQQGDQQYFADGLAEEILHLLAQSPELRVTARSSSFMISPQLRDVVEIARLLEVRHVVKGSVRREGEALRVTVQLVDARTGTHVWSQTYDRSFSSMLDLQSEIAARVAAALQVTLTQQPRSASRSAAEAHDHYLLGRHLFLRRGPGDLEAAEQQFALATRLDPQHARAWTALAGALSVHALDERRDPTHRLEEQRQALERALAIDPTLAEAHVRLGRYFEIKGLTEERQHAFDRARQLAPNDVLVLSTLSTRALRDGRVDEARELQRRIVVMDPLSALYRRNLAHILLGAGRYDEALAELQRAQALSPEMETVRVDVALALMLLGRDDEARQALASAPAGDRRDQMWVLLGDPPQAAAGRQSLEASETVWGRLLLAEVAAHRGDADAAFTLLEAARLAHAAMPGWSGFDLRREVNVSALLRGLQQDPRWAQLQQALAEP